MTVSDPAELDRAAALLKEQLAAPVQRSPEGSRLSVMAPTPEAANSALSALVSAGIALEDFAMGSPSLEEVFFALTGSSASQSEDAA